MKLTLKYLLVLTILIVGCSKNPGEPEPCDPEEIIIEVPVVCDVLDLVLEFTFVVDQSAPNVYGVALNDVEFARFVIDETSQEITFTTRQLEVNEYVFGQDKISVYVISGSRAEAPAYTIISAECSE